MMDPPTGTGPSKSTASANRSPPVRRRRVERIVAIVVLAAAVWALGELLWSCYCAFLSGKFFYNDYARYTQMIRNCVLGQPFQYTPTDNYLAVHLSFTLALLGPLFLLWDHAFLLSLVQWLSLAGGFGLLAFCLRRQRVPPVMAAAILFFWAAYPVTQGLMLDEFHTVGLYYLLVPWLYCQILVNRSWAWLPCVLILGVREDAALFLLPPLFYFARRDRWRGGYVLLATAVAYCVVAIFVLYPAINGASLFAFRSEYMRTEAPAGPALPRRLFGLSLMLLPLLTGAPVRWLWPVALVLLGGLLPAMLSGHPRQQMLRTIYAGPVLVWIPVVLIEAWTAWRRNVPALPARGRRAWAPLVQAVLLTTAVCVLHRYTGFVRFGFFHHLACYRHPSAMHRYAAQLEAAIPKERVLLTDMLLAAHSSARAGVYDWDHFDPARFHYDTVLTTLAKLPHRLNGAVLEEVRRGTLGVAHTDGLFVTLCRRAATNDNQALIASLSHRHTLIAATHKHAGEDRPTAHGFARYWHGNTRQIPVTLSFGSKQHLPAGRHVARLHYTARAPRRDRSGSWGRFTLHHPGSGDPPLAQIDVPRREEAPAPALQTLDLELVLTDATPVEFRVTGEAAELWLHHVEWLEQPAAPPAAP